MESLLKVKDFAKRLECSESKAYGIVERGEIDHVALHGIIRLEPQDVEAYIKNLKTRGIPEHRRKPHLRKSAENSR